MTDPGMNHGHLTEAEQRQAELTVKENAMPFEEIENPIAEHFDWHTLMSVEDGAPNSLTAALDKYFEPFADAPADGSVECLKCSTPLGGMMGAVLDGFTWGLVHGEGHCATCRWPARAYHFIKYDDKEIRLPTFILQYHPDFVESKKRAEQ